MQDIIPCRKRCMIFIIRDVLLSQRQQVQIFQRVRLLRLPTAGYITEMAEEAMDAGI